MVGQKYSPEQQKTIKRIIKDYPNIGRRLSDIVFLALTSSIQRTIQRTINLGTLKGYIKRVRREHAFYIMPRPSSLEISPEL
jgi:hypothetical protein